MTQAQIELQPPTPRTRTGIIAQIGYGQVGSHAAGDLARIPGVREMIFIDPDSFTAQNLSSQNIAPADVGQPKAIVAARGSPVPAQSVVDRVENIPWGILRQADVICACVDSKHARAAINHIATRLGITWIDAGVQGEGMLARVNVYRPGHDAPCLECVFGDRDYELMSQRYACDGALKPAAATNAPAALGAMAAAMMVLECHKLLAGEIEQTLNGRQWILEARHHHQYVNTLRRNPACRFDHNTWQIERIDAPLRTLRDLAEIAHPLAISLDRNPWVTRLACPRCGQQSWTIRLQRRLASMPHPCAACDAEAMQPMGFYLRPQLAIPSSRSAALLDRPLARLGLRSGDVITLIMPGAERHVELPHVAAEQGA
jgi:molybdopterin/thiamine biosynthesis adenylyltransferase